MPYVDAGRSRLYYESYGAGPALLLAHGVGGNHASWFNQVPTFAQRHRVVVFDHRGFGNSSDAEEAGRAAFVDDLRSLLDALGIERTVLIGQSMGGGTCLGFTCRHPHRVRALVLADTLIALALPEELRPCMAEVEARTRDLSQAERVLGPRTRREDPERTLLYLQIASFNAVNVRTLRGEQARHSPEELAATGVPVLFVAGEDDALFPPRAIRAVHARVAGSRYVEIPGAGHSAYFEAPAQFNRAVLDFLEAVTGAPAAAIEA